MGEKVGHQTFTGADRTAYRDKLNGCLDVLGQMLADGWFEAEPSTDTVEPSATVYGPPASATGGRLSWDTETTRLSTPAPPSSSVTRSVTV